MAIHYYILEDRVPRPASLEKWSSWFETADRQVCETFVGSSRISTVFIGIDADIRAPDPNWFLDAPLVFETMVFTEGWDDRSDPDKGMEQRYATWDDAMAGHMAIVYRLTVDAQDAS